VPFTNYAYSDLRDSSYAAAAQSKLDFKLFISLDMSFVFIAPCINNQLIIGFSSFPCSSPQDAQVLRNLVSTYLSHPNQLQYDSRPVVSTFAGESCTFGQGSPAEGWQTQFVSALGKVYFIPSFFVDPNNFRDFSNVMDGDFNVRIQYVVEQK
jgi:glucan endo-1,3-alpha-glucosidase